MVRGVYLASPEAMEVRIARNQMLQLVLVLSACALLARLGSVRLTPEAIQHIPYDPNGPPLILGTRYEHPSRSITGVSQGSQLLVRTHKHSRFRSGTPRKAVEASFGPPQFYLPQTPRQLAWKLKTSWRPNSSPAGEYLWIHFDEDGRAEYISPNGDLFEGAVPYGAYDQTRESTEDASPEMTPSLRDASVSTNPREDKMRMEYLLEEAPSLKVIDFLSDQYERVKFTPHPTLNGFYAEGSREDLIQIKRELTNIGRYPEPPPVPVGGKLK